MRGFLAVTRGEQMLLRLFLPDALEKYSLAQRDERVRAIKSLVQKHARWTAIYKPVPKRAQDAMALKPTTLRCGPWRRSLDLYNIHIDLYNIHLFITIYV